MSLIALPRTTMHVTDVLIVAKLWRRLWALRFFPVLRRRTTAEQIPVAIDIINTVDRRQELALPLFGCRKCCSFPAEGVIPVTYQVTLGVWCVNQWVVLSVQFFCLHCHDLFVDGEHGIAETIDLVK